MTNDLRIVPSVATPRMWSEMFRIIKEEGKDCQEAYQAALSAAPDYSHLVIVERKELEGLAKNLSAERQLSHTWALIAYLYFKNTDEAKKLADTLVKKVVCEGLIYFREDHIEAEFQRNIAALKQGHSQ